MVREARGRSVTSSLPWLVSEKPLGQSAARTPTQSTTALGRHPKGRCRVSVDLTLVLFPRVVRELHGGIGGSIISRIRDQEKGSFIRSNSQSGDR